MNLPNIRIGNDLPISFFVEINSGGTLLTTDNTTILLYDPNGNLVDIRWSISGNQVSGTFLGANQRYTGIYTLKVILNKGTAGMATSDRQMFRLVPHSWQGDTDPEALEDFEIRLTDVLSIDEMEELRDLLSTDFPSLSNRVTDAESSLESLSDRTSTLEGNQTQLDNRTTNVESRVTNIENNVVTAEETEAALEEIFNSNL